MIKNLDGNYETIIYGECKSIKLYLNTQDENYPLHWHTAPEVIMPIENTYTVKSNKTTWVLNPGDIIIISPGELHSLEAPQTGTRAILQFDLSLIKYIGVFEMVFPFLYPCALITKSKFPETYDALREILVSVINSYNSENMFKESAIYAQLINFFNIVFEQLIQNDNIANLSKQSDYMNKFFYICNYISEHCDEPLTLESVAKTAGFSKFHFSRLFKQFTGSFYYDYLNQCRIKKAAESLGYPGVSITEAAMSCGFNSLSTFNRVFKKYKNCTPSEYKTLFRQNSSLEHH